MVNAKASGLLPSAIEYAVHCVSHVTQASLPRRTPCTEWNLAELLCHVNDSLAILYEGVAWGFVAGGPMAEPDDFSVDALVRTFNDRARRFLAAATPPSGDEYGVAVADRVLPRDILVAVGVVEVAVHGWDVAFSCDVLEPIPAGLASGIMELAPDLLTAESRNGDFGPPVQVSPLAAPVTNSWRSSGEDRRLSIGQLTKDLVGTGRLVA
ncbi:maleylpyruvate isomerase N-terminal domain-containing protein [Nonomuraea thailandensis]